MSEQYGWIGVDLDKTLAEYESWVSDTHIGKPIPNMVKIVKEHLSAGDEVRVFTARMCRNSEQVSKAIYDWTLEHIGVGLIATNVKDFEMKLLYDDRAVGVVPNTGRLLHENSYATGYDYGRLDGYKECLNKYGDI